MNDLEESISIEDDFLNDNFFNAQGLDEVSEESPVSELSEDQNERGCNQRACDQLCRRLKFPGGACVNGRCKCDNFFATEADFSETSLTVSELSEVQNERGCNPRACDQLCRRLKFPGGTCVNGRCKCDNFFGTEDTVDEYSELDTRRGCRITKCNRTCTRLGYDSATCVNRRCKCYNKTRADISETSFPVSELSEDQNERGCNPRACDQLCRRLKFPGGACVNDRCKCDNFFGTEDAVDEFSQLDTRRVCKLRECNRTCTRRGYERARCVNGWCKCYNKIQREDASPLNEVTSDANEESNEILRTNEEELSDASPRACNTPSCNQMCHRLKYAGGWCRFGQCQCY